MSAEAWERRFWERVDKTGDCWIWTGSRNGKGYGVSVRDKAKGMAHRRSFEMLKAPIPTGMVLDHLCRTPPCVNPDHLEPVTVAENNARGVVRDVTRQRHAKRTHCKSGHLVSGENEYKAPDGRRKCRECMKTYSRNYWNRKKADRD